MFNSLKFSSLTVGKVLALLIMLACFNLASFATYADLRPAFLNDTYTARFLWKEQNAKLTNRTFSCPTLMEPVYKFESNSIYKDTPCRCEVDPEKKAAYDAEVGYLRDYAKLLTKLSDRYVATPVERPEIAQCLSEHIHNWTANGAMLGEHNHSVGYHKTAELIGVVSSSVLKIRYSNNYINGIQLVKDDLDTWLISASEHIKYFYENIAGGRTRLNNHRYWDSFQLGQASVVLQDDSLFQWAMEGLRIGLNQINDDGYLPLELVRGDKAFDYHAYAMIPLVMLAELSIQNSTYQPGFNDPYSANQNGLIKLASNILNEDQGTSSGIFTEARSLKCHESVWLEAYSRRTALEDNSAIHLITNAKRQACNGYLKNTYVGGNMTVLQGTPN